MDGPSEPEGVEVFLPHLRGEENARRVIPWRELTFRSDTSGGPGGQHANRSATRVTLLWRPGTSDAFSDEEKAQLEENMADRISSEGVLRVRIASERNQAQNKKECLGILCRLIRDALKPEVPRVSTRPTRGSRRRRLESKQRQSRLKESRRPPRTDEE